LQILMLGRFHAVGKNNQRRRWNFSWPRGFAAGIARRFGSKELS